MRGNRSKYRSRSASGDESTGVALFRLFAQAPENHAVEIAAHRPPARIRVGIALRGPLSGLCQYQLAISGDRLVTHLSVSQPLTRQSEYAVHTLGPMKTLLGKISAGGMALCVCLLPAHSIAEAAEPIAVPMTADHWQTKENAEFLRQLGFYQGLMRLNSGEAVLKDITFGDGTIEFDVNTIGRGAPGIAFRQQNADNFELLYLRPDAACPAFAACMQYAPQTHGVLLWDLFPQYQTRAPLRENGWNHVKLVISGRRMSVFVNDSPSPTLQVDRLEGDALEGGLHLEGPATFANMVITPGAVDGLSPEPLKDRLDGDRGMVRSWRLSAVSTLPKDKEPSYAEMPSGPHEWKPISAERNGLVNLSREYGLPVHEPNQGLAWLKTTIASDRNQAKKADIGWAREVWVFVNGKLVYSGKNLWDDEAERKAPDGRCSLENGSFTLSLKPGDNEVAVAIANNFYGWGLMLRLADPDGVNLAAK